MGMIKSKITSQGQVSVPAPIRQRLGVGPGSAISWEDVNGDIVVRRAGKYTFADIHRATRTSKPRQAVSVEQMDQGIAHLMRANRERRGY